MVAIVTTTYHRREKFVTPLLDLLDKLWVDHAPVWFITDGSGIKHPNSIRISSKSWTVRLYEGLQQFHVRCPDIQYVYLLPEDNYPLWVFSVERVVDAQNYAIKNNLNCVTFTPVNFIFENEKRLATEKGFLYEVPESFDPYSQIQVGIWKLSHLLDTCSLALEKNVLDIWSFEHIVTSGHYVSDYRWPTFVDGFFRQGRVDSGAVDRIKIPEGTRLKRALTFEFILMSPCYLLRALEHAVCWRIEKAYPRK